MKLDALSRGCASLHRNRGFTLIEMMIAMILGLIVIAGVASVFLAGQRSYRTNNALDEVASGSRISFELLARDIRQAGATACNSSNTMTNVVNGGTTAWYLNFGQPIFGYDGDQADASNPFGTAATPGSRVPGTSELQLMNGGDSPVSIAVDHPGTNFFINDPTTTLQTGDVIVACSLTHTAIVQITNYNNNNVTVVYNTGSRVSPGNCSSNLGPGNYNGCTGNSPLYSFPKNSQIAKLSAHEWYIGYNGSGTGSGMSLYRQSLTAGTGVVGSPQEIVRNVTGMDITYLQNGATGFASASVVGPAGSAGWNTVTAVRVVLTLASGFQRATVDAKPLTRQVAFTTTIRNRVN